MPDAVDKCGKCGSENVETIWKRFGPDNEAEPAWLECKDCGENSCNILQYGIHILPLLRGQVRITVLSYPEFPDK